MLIPQHALLQDLRLRLDDRIEDLAPRLRCRECDERGKAVVAGDFIQQTTAPGSANQILFATEPLRGGR